MLGIDPLSHAPVSSLDLGPVTVTPAIRIATIPAMIRSANPVDRRRVQSVDAQNRSIVLPKSVRERSP